MREKKKLKALLAILIVLVVVFLGLKFFNDREAEKKIEAEQESKISITDLGKLQTISYENGTENISLKKEEGTWILSDEPEVPLNQEYITTMESEITDLTADRELEEPDELDAYGLKKPAYTLKVTDENDKECTIYVGNGADDSYYLTVDDQEHIYTGGSSLVSAIQYEKTQLVENDSVPSIGNDQVTKVVINSSKDGKTTYTKKKNEDEISTILGGMGSLSFDGCVDYNATAKELKEYGLDKASRTTITVQYTDSEGDSEETSSFKLYIGNADDTDTYQYVQVDGSNIVNRALIDTVKNILNK